MKAWHSERPHGRTMGACIQEVTFKALPPPENKGLECGGALQQKTSHGMSSSTQRQGLLLMLKVADVACC